MSAARLPTARASALLALIAGSPLAGCGDDFDPVVDRDGSIEIRARDYRFEPQAVRSPRQRVRIELRNTGRLPHALRLRLEGRERLRIPTVLPGRRGSVSARLEPGSYRLYCPIGNHEELGMYGTFVVG